VAIAPSPFDDAPRVVHDLYERHALALRAFCLQSLRNRDDAEEAVQATFLRALGALRSGVRPRSERAWLLTIARNVCATRATCAHRRREVALDATALEDVAATGSIPDLGLDAELVAALEALPDGQRRAFVLRAVDGLTYEEIARELGVSHAAVESWILRARRKLAEAVRDRRRRLAADLSSAAGLLKSLFAGGAALKAGAVAVAAVAVGTSVALAPHRSPTPQATAAQGTAAAAASPAVVRAARPEKVGARRAIVGPARAQAAPAATVPTSITTEAVTTVDSTPHGHSPAPASPPQHAEAPTRATPVPHALPSTPLDPVVEPVQETLAPVTDALKPVTEQLPLPDLTQPGQLPALPVEPPKLPPLLP
jgi:RNA polymerase sigma-70 factor (ECF subfamily)